VATRRDVRHNESSERAGGGARGNGTACRRSQGGGRSMPRAPAPPCVARCSGGPGTPLGLAGARL